MDETELEQLRKRAVAANIAGLVFVAAALTLTAAMWIAGYITGPLAAALTVPVVMTGAARITLLRRIHNT